MPTKSISNIDPESIPSSRSSAGVDEILITPIKLEIYLGIVFLGYGIAESRNPQATHPHPPTPVIVDKTKNKQGTFPWLVNLAGPPGIPGYSFSIVSKENQVNNSCLKLSGVDGMDGVDGRDGKDGKDGAQGPAGPPGTKGDTGKLI